MLPHVDFLFLFCRGQLSFVAVVKVSRDFLAQINTGRGCKLGPLWLDVNRAYVNVSCGYMKTQTSSFSRVNLLPVLILKLHGRSCPASFPTAKKVLFSYFLCILNIFWAHLQQCLLKTKIVLLKLHPAALSQLYFRLITKLCWLKNTENNFVYISKGRRLSQHCWCAGFHLISDSLKEHLIFWEIHRPVPNVHMRLQQLVCLIDHKKFASVFGGWGEGAGGSREWHHLYCGLSTLAQIGNNILWPMGFTGYTHIWWFQIRQTQVSSKQVFGGFF